MELSNRYCLKKGHHWTLNSWQILLMDYLWISVIKCEILEKKLSFLEEGPWSGMYPGSDPTIVSTRKTGKHFLKLITQPRASLSFGHLWRVVRKASPSGESHLDSQSLGCPEFWEGQTRVLRYLWTPWEQKTGWEAMQENRKWSSAIAKHRNHWWGWEIRTCR